MNYMRWYLNSRCCLRVDDGSEELPLLLDAEMLWEELEGGTPPNPPADEDGGVVDGVAVVVAVTGGLYLRLRELDAEPLQRCKEIDGGGRFWIVLPD